MEAGFGAVHERFEQTFGKRATDFILGLIGLATIAICCAIIWTLGLGPIVHWLSPLLVEAGLATPLLKALFGALGFAGGSGLVLYLGNRLERWWTMRTARNVIAARRRLLRDQMAFEQRTREFEERLTRAE